MSTPTTDSTISKGFSSVNRLKAYLVLTKFRLSFLVVVSALICFVIGSEKFDLPKMFWLFLGGYLVTGASNTFNQIIEKELDRLMDRTRTRPLPTNQVSVYEALMLGLCMLSLGIMILYFLMNPLSGILGALATALYTIAYTPLKRKTPFAVFVGAIPGAIPPLLGYVAATNRIDIIALLLFAVQFMWQFPHFWAIAWILDEDYKKAGFKMLPSNQKDKRSAFQIMTYTFSLIPISFLPFAFKFNSLPASVLMALASVWFSWLSVKVYKSCQDEDARKLMFGSFLYLPIVQLIAMIDRLI